jgi:hypothetical protein
VSNDNIVHLKQSGDTKINWSISYGPGPVTDSGRIGFSTDPSTPGIVFTGTPPWPGTPPSGNANNWSARITNAQNGQQFYFKVNAVIRGDGPDQPLTWDPEVEEDPPRLALT